MADDPKALVAQAERDAEGGDHGSALRALEQAYVPVQKARDLETTERALALARRIAEDDEAAGRDRRKARGIAAWYEILVRDRAWSAARTARRSAARVHPRSLGWIDSVVLILAAFVVLELLVGAVVAIGASTANERIVAIAGAIFGATMLLALIAIIRLLQAIERNTGPAGEQPAHGGASARSSEPGDGARAHAD